MTLHGDEYDCLECWHSQDTPMPTSWDMPTWQEGYARGLFEGLEEGHHLGVRAVCSDLLDCLRCWGIDYHLGLHGTPSPQEVLHEVTCLVEQLCAPAVVPCEEGSVGGARSTLSTRLAYAGTEN
jgi:hypothetical protein